MNEQRGIPSRGLAATLLCTTLSGGLACSPMEPEPPEEPGLPTATLTGAATGDTLVNVTDWIMQDLPNRQHVSDLGFGGPGTASTATASCTRRLSATVPMTSEYLSRNASGTVIESDFYRQLGGGPFDLVGIHQGHNIISGFAGTGYTRFCMGTEPLYSGWGNCNTNTGYGIVLGQPAANHQYATTGTATAAQWGWVYGRPHSQAPNVWPLAAPYALPAGVEVFNDASIGSTSPWRAEAFRKSPGGTACSGADDITGIHFSRTRYVYLTGVNFGACTGPIYDNLNRKKADGRLCGTHDALVVMTEYDGFACGGLSQTACGTVPVCSWVSSACQLDVNKVNAARNQLNRLNEQKLSLTWYPTPDIIPQTLHGSQTEMYAYVRGYGRIAGVFGGDPDCNLSECLSSTEESQYACMTKCNGSYGFTTDPTLPLTGYAPSTVYTSQQLFTTPYKANFVAGTKNAMRTGYPNTASSMVWRNNIGYFFKPYYRDAPGLCAGRSDSNPHYNTLAPGYSWCGSFQ